TDLFGITTQHLPLGVHHETRSRVEKYRGVAFNPRYSRWRAGGGAFKLVRRAAVRASDWIQRSQVRRWLRRHGARFSADERTIGWPHQQSRHADDSARG